MSRTLLLTGLFLFLATCCLPSRAESGARNSDFEQGILGEMPLEWKATHALRSGYRVALVDRSPHGGRACVEVARDSNAFKDAGAIVQTVDAAPFRGRRVSLRGWLRFAGRPGRGGMHLWMRVDRPREATGFYDDMNDRPVWSTEWTEARIVGEVAADADSIAFGAMLTGDGTGHADDLVLEALGSVHEGNRSAAPLSNRGLANLVAFTRLLGYVRHFHPSDESARANWDVVAIAGVQEVEGARTPRDLARRLERFFRPLAPTLRVANRPLPALDPRAMTVRGSTATHITGWWHLGWRGSSAQSQYHSRRPRAPIGAASDSVLALGAEHRADLGGGVWCSVPLAVLADSLGTLPRASATSPKLRRPDGWLPSGNDRSTRLAAVALMWNVAQHFYPYFDVVDVDWPEQLAIALRAAAADHDADAFQATLERMIAALQDGHGNVHSATRDLRPVPLTWTTIEDRLVVTHVHESMAGRIRAGDEVTAIDGRPIAEAIEEIRRRSSAATPQHLRHVVETRLPELAGDSLTLDLASVDGALRRERVPRGWERPARPDSIAEPAPGVIYVDLDRVTRADFERELPRLAKARGIVFDVRGYPRVPHWVPGHFVDSTIASPQWHKPIVTRPDQEDVTFQSSDWLVQPREPRLTAPVAFLIDGRAISYAETFLGMVERYRLGELVGEATAGTNGNVVTQLLPGGYRVGYTGMKVLKHDGSRHHGVGIQPTVPVRPTRAGVAAGRDEQLERAIAVVSGIPSSAH